MANGSSAGRTLLGFLIYVPLQRWMTIGLQVRAAPLSCYRLPPQMSVKARAWHYARVLAMCCTTAGVQWTCIVSGFHNVLW